MEIVINGLEMLTAGEVTTRIIKERIASEVTLTTFKRLATDENYLCGDDFLNWGKYLTLDAFLSTSQFTEVMANCVVPIEVILTPVSEGTKVEIRLWNERIISEITLRLQE